MILDNGIIEVEEVWKTIKSYEKLYKVSNMGRVRYLDRIVPHPRIHNQTVKGRLLKPNVDKDGYHSVQLCKYGKIRSRRVHHLVAEAFIPNPEGKPIINHKDGIKNNNIVDNLEWSTCRENEDHAVLNRLKASGERSNNARFTADQVLEIRKRLDLGERGCDLAREFGVSATAISYIRLRKNWKYI